MPQKPFPFAIFIFSPLSLVYSLHARSDAAADVSPSIALALANYIQGGGRDPRASSPDAYLRTISSRGAKNRMPWIVNAVLAPGEAEASETLTGRLGLSTRHLSSAT